MADKNQSKVNPIQVQKFLKGIKYPCSKQDLVKKAKSEGADQNVLDTLQKIPDRDYDAPTDVTKEIGKIE